MSRFRGLGRPPRNVFLRTPLLLIKDYRVSAWVVVSIDRLVVASDDITVAIGMFIAIARKKTQKRSLWIHGDEGRDQSSFFFFFLIVVFLGQVYSNIHLDTYYAAKFKFTAPPLPACLFTWANSS